MADRRAGPRQGPYLPFLEGQEPRSRNPDGTWARSAATRASHFRRAAVRERMVSSRTGNDTRLVARTAGMLTRCPGRFLSSANEDSPV